VSKIVELLYIYYLSRGSGYIHSERDSGIGGINNIYLGVAGISTVSEIVELLYIYYLSRGSGYIQSERDSGIVKYILFI